MRNRQTPLAGPAPRADATRQRRLRFRRWAAGPAVPAILGLSVLTAGGASSPARASVAPAATGDVTASASDVTSAWAGFRGLPGPAVRVASLAKLPKPSYVEICLGVPPHATGCLSNPRARLQGGHYLKICQYRCPGAAADNIWQLTAAGIVGKDGYDPFKYEGAYARFAGDLVARFKAAPRKRDSAYCAEPNPADVHGGRLVLEKCRNYPNHALWVIHNVESGKPDRYFAGNVYAINADPQQDSWGMAALDQDGDSIYDLTWSTERGKHMKWDAYAPVH